MPEGKWLTTAEVAEIWTTFSSKPVNADIVRRWCREHDRRLDGVEVWQWRPGAEYLIERDSMLNELERWANSVLATVKRERAKA